MICTNCASRIKSKTPEQYEFEICKCDYCNERSYCASESSWGISTTSGKDLGDQGIEMLNNLLFK